MGKSRSLGFFIKTNKLTVGDKFRTTSMGSNRIVESIDPNRKIVTACGVTHQFSEKVYIENFPVSNQIEKQKTPKKTYTISYSATVDFEFVDTESESIEDSLMKARALTSWQLIQKGTVVDVTRDPNIFAIIENEV